MSNKLEPFFLQLHQLAIHLPYLLNVSRVSSSFIHGE